MVLIQSTYRIIINILWQIYVTIVVSHLTFALWIHWTSLHMPGDLHITVTHVTMKLPITLAFLCLFPLSTGWVFLVSQTVKNLPAVWGPGLNPWVGKFPWRRAWQSSSILSWRIPTDRRACQVKGHSVAESDTTEQLSTAAQDGQITHCFALHKILLPLLRMLYFFTLS